MASPASGIACKKWNCAWRNGWVLPSADGTDRQRNAAGDQGRYQSPEGTAERPTPAVIADLAASLARQQAKGDVLALVTSGAVGLGCGALKLAKRPTEVVALQAAAAVGQGQLMALYQDAFTRSGLSVAQVLLTRGISPPGAVIKMPAAPSNSCSAGGGARGERKRHPGHR